MPSGMLRCFEAFPFLGRACPQVAGRRVVAGKANICWHRPRISICIIVAAAAAVTAKLATEPLVDVFLLAINVYIQQGSIQSISLLIVVFIGRHVVLKVGQWSCLLKNVENFSLTFLAAIAIGLKKS